MPERDYAELKEAVEAAGFFTDFRHEDRGDWIVLVSHRTDGRLHGNSIRASIKGGQWFLFTWVPIFYRLAPETDLIALCIDCLRSPQSILGAIPPDIMARHPLVEISEAQYNGTFLS